MLACLKAWSNNSATVSSTTDDAYQQDLERLEFVAYGIVGGTVVSFGVVGNILNLIVLSRPYLKGITFTYLSWLAISDLLTLVTSATSLLRLLDSQPTTFAAAVYYSHVELPVVNAFMACSVFLVVALTVDRYFSVCHPTRFKDVHNKEWARRSVAASYVLAFLVYVPVCFEKHPVRFQENDSGSVRYVACENHAVVDNAVYKTYVMAKEVVVRLGPVVALVVLNVSIIVSFYRRRQQTTCRSSSFRKKTREEHRLVVLLAVIVFVFFVCMTPASVLMVLYTEEKDVLYGFQVFRAVANVLELSNYSLNFYVYCLCVVPRFGPLSAGSCPGSPKKLFYELL